MHNVTKTSLDFGHKKFAERQHKIQWEKYQWNYAPCQQQMKKKKKTKVIDQKLSAVPYHKVL